MQRNSSMNQGQRNGTQFDLLQSIILPFLVRCGFWLLVQWWVYPWFSHSFPRERTARISSRSITVTNKSNSLTYTLASPLVCTLPLAVITVVGLLDILMVSNSAELRSFLLTISILAPESTTNSLFFRLFFLMQPAIPILPRASGMKLCPFLWAYMCFWQGSTPCFGHIAVVFQSLPEICPQIS